MRDTVYTGLRIYNMSQTQEITNKIYDQFISYNELQDTERLSDIMRDNILDSE